MYSYACEGRACRMSWRSCFRTSAISSIAGRRLCFVAEITWPTPTARRHDRLAVRDWSNSLEDPVSLCSLSYKCGKLQEVWKGDFNHHCRHCDGQNCALCGEKCLKDLKAPAVACHECIKRIQTDVSSSPYYTWVPVLIILGTFTCVALSSDQGPYSETQTYGYRHNKLCSMSPVGSTFSSVLMMICFLSIGLDSMRVPSP